LKNGVPNGKGGLIGGYRYSGEALKIFEDFFGTTNPHNIALDERGNQLGPLEEKALSMFDTLKARFNNLTLYCKCTLEEFAFGSQKSLWFERITLEGDKKHEKIEVVEKIVHVKPGMGAGSVITFEGEGHERFNRDRSDLVIVLSQVPHKTYRRIGNDLEYQYKISF